MDLGEKGREEIVGHDIDFYLDKLASVRKVTEEEFANFWRSQPEVIHVSTYTDIMKKIHQTMHADDRSWYKLPDNLDLASQYLLLYEMSLPFGLDLNKSNGNLVAEHNLNEFIHFSLLEKSHMENIGVILKELLLCSVMTRANIVQSLLGFMIESLMFPSFAHRAAARPESDACHLPARMVGITCNRCAFR